MKNFLARFFKKWRLGLVGLIVALALAPSIYFYRQYKQAQDKLQNPTDAAKLETRELVATVGKLIMLPTDEDPTIALVKNKEELKNQPFFANAVNGDKVLLFMKAKKAILYRPTSNKIIEVAPLNINSASDSAQVSAPRPGADLAGAPARFVLWNGTKIIGLTKKYQPKVTAIAGATVVDTDNAKKNDYEKTILVDIAGTKGDQAQQLAQRLGIAVGELPPGETAPANADFLIILGADQK